MNAPITINLLKNTLFFLITATLVMVVLLSYDLLTCGVSIAGEYHTYYMSDIIEYFKSFFVS